jgi:DNA-binding response OmpR family regulator
MRHLRAKLEANPAAPQLLKTVPGLGYCFQQDGAS